ncbi:MAG: hypothetical protein L6R39_002947, partial [Caloplaca ligustica]
MPSTLFTIITSVTAALIGLFSAPILHEYGLAPYFWTLPSKPTFTPNVGLFDDNIFDTAYHEYVNATSTLPAIADPFLYHTPPVHDMPTKASSGTSTTPPPPPPPNPTSATSFYRYLMGRLLTTIITVVATASLRLTNFWQLNPMMPSSPRIVVKQRSIRDAVVAKPDFLDLPLVKARMISYLDKATDLPTSLPPSPTASQTSVKEPAALTLVPAVTIYSVEPT